MILYMNTLLPYIKYNQVGARGMALTEDKNKLPRKLRQGKCHCKDYTQLGLMWG